MGSFTLYHLKKVKKAPAAIINRDCETITAVGCIIAEIPCIDQIPIDQIQQGASLVVDGEKGTVELE